jgi:hypothetical protein
MMNRPQGRTCFRRGSLLQSLQRTGKDPHRKIQIIRNRAASLSGLTICRNLGILCLAHRIRSLHENRRITFGYRFYFRMRLEIS